MQQRQRDTLGKPSHHQAEKASGSSVQMKRAVGQVEGFEAQTAALEPGSAPVQAKGQPAGNVHAAAASGVASGGGTLPHLGAIQKAFGRHEVGNIKAHTGAAATQANKSMGAEAYATGNHIAFSGGAPDLRTTAHEATHIVQQRSGLSLPGGVGKSGDAYEQHADMVADSVVKGESVEGLLDEKSGSGGAGAVQQRAIQLKAVSGGTELQAVQEKLNMLGFDCGKPDGISGPKTRAAIVGFQQSRGLDADGIIGPKTLTALDEAVAGQPAGGSSQSGAAGAGTAQSGSGAQSGSPASAKSGQSGQSGQSGVDTKAPGKDEGAPSAGSGGQAKGLEDKKTETKGKPFVKPSPAEIDKKEGEFSSEGQSSLSAVKGLGGAMLNGGGDTKGAAINGYPAWFTELQDTLVNSASWTDTHESAQNVLYRYAMWKTECNLGYVPASVEFFFRYIGKSAGNNEAAKKNGKKGAGDLGGYTNAKNWCAQATTSAAVEALKARGLRFRGGVEKWMQAAGGKAKAGSYWCTKCNGVDLGPGDSVSYLGANHNNNTGHRVTVLENLGGGVFSHVSGNAGGGGSGSVRIGMSRREDVPGAFSPTAKKSEPRPKGDAVWVYSIQKTGDIFAELSRLDGVPATDPAFDTLLTELRLERIR